MTMILLLSAALNFSRRSGSFCVNVNQMLLKTLAWGTESVELRCKIVETKISAHQIMNTDWQILKKRIESF